MFSIIVCCCKTGAIGRNNDILHHIKEDLLFFKKLTLNHTVIVGRKTYESIPNRLPNRKIIILTSDLNYKCPFRDDITVVCKIEDALNLVRQDEEVFIIGGATVYEQTIKFANKIYMTLVLDNCEGDTYFKNFNKEEWDLTEEENFITTKGLKYKRLIFLRK